MKTTLRFHGVNNAAMRAACKELAKANRELSREALHEIVETLYATDYFDLRSAGLVLLEIFHKRFDARTSFTSFVFASTRRPVTCVAR
jgi:hypothetical protein